MKIAKLFGGINMQPLVWALRQHHELWNVDRERTVSPESPHREMDDIWVRYMEKPLVEGPHESIWYPAADLLPVRDYVLPLMADLKAERLGGVLITRLPPGRHCYRHNDAGGWHAEYYRKFAMQIESAPGQAFCFDGERLESKPGDVYEFENRVDHWVENPTQYERITMIVCLKI